MKTNNARILMARALDYRALRQDLISSNIANVDTPFYRSRDLFFEDALIKEREKLYNRHSSKKLQMAITNPMHLEGNENDSLPKAEIFFRDGHMVRNDGNSVDLDVETTEMAKNSVMYNALVMALRKNSMLFKTAIESSAKI